MKYLSFCFALLATSSAYAVSGVQIPGDGAEERRNLQLQTEDAMAPEIGILFTGLSALGSELPKYETPIVIRFAAVRASNDWNCVAVYSTDFKDAFTKKKPAVRVMDETLHDTHNRAMCVVQATASFWSLTIPDAVQEFQKAMASIGIDDVDTSLNSDVAACKDTACLQALADASEYSPKMMGHIVAKMSFDYAIQDGFNQLGLENGCTANCRNFSDTTGYAPKKGGRDRWSPLKEDNGKGFFFLQEHVTPHIGQKAKFRALSEGDRASRVAKKPKYSRNRRKEAMALLDRMANLNDVKKMQAEVFDNKLTVAGVVVNAFIGQVLSSVDYQDEQLGQGQKGVVLSYERLLHFLAAHDMAEYESIVISWKEKVHYDLVRPPTIIKSWGKEMITTWTREGTRQFEAKDFEAYMRIMPHSEYPSGSSCLFKAQAELVTDYLVHMGLSPTLPVEFAFKAGSSSVEPGVVPAQDIVLSYSTLEEMAIAGGESRLDAGVHFAEAVYAGFDLCTGVGSRVASVAIGLY